MTQNSYRPPSAPVGDPEESLARRKSLAVGVSVGLLAGAGVLALLSTILAAFVVGTHPAVSYEEARRQIVAHPYLTHYLFAIRALSGFAGAWCAARLTRRWLASALWLTLLLAGAPIVAPLFLGYGIGREAWTYAFYLVGTLPGARLATWGDRQ